MDADSAVTFGYDSLGSLELETLRIDNGPVRTVSHVNDDRGNRLSTVYPGARSLAYTPDALDRVKTIVDTTGGGSSALAAYDYVGGRVARRTYSAAGTQLDYAYDGTGVNAPGDFGAGRVAGTSHTVTTGGAPVDPYKPTL